MLKVSMMFPLCILCKQPARLMCQRCRDVYCSPYCQSKDWSDHKINCIPMPSLVPFCEPRHGNMTKFQVKSLHSLTDLDQECVVEFVNKIQLLDEKLPEIADTSSSSSKPMAQLTDLSRNISNLKIGKPNICSSNGNTVALNKGPIIVQSDKTEAAKEESPIICAENKKSIIVTPAILPPVPKQAGLVEAAQTNIKNNMIFKTISNNQPIIEPVKEQQITKNTILQDSNPTNGHSQKTDVKANEVKEHSPTSSIKSEPVKEQQIIKNTILQDSNPTNGHSQKTDVKANELKEHSPTSSIKSGGLPAVKRPPSANWKEPFAIEGNLIDVIIQYIDGKDSSIFWMIEKAKLPACNKLLREINKNITMKSPPCGRDEIKIGHLVAVLFEEIYYRAVILDVIENFDDVFVRLIDYGNQFYVKANTIKEPIPIMNNLNAFAFKVKMSKPRNLNIGDELTVNKLTKTIDGAYLVKEHVKSVSEMNDAINEYVENEKRKMIIYTMDNLKIVGIPVSMKTNIHCLDSTKIHEGEISACFFDVEFILELEESSGKICDYVQELDDKYYQPQLNELCVALFEDDGNWYRTVCEEILPNDVYKLRFIDYGNIKNCHKNLIRHITKEFLFPCCTQTCIISTEFVEIRDNKAFGKIQKYLDEEQSVEIDCATKIDDSYVIVISNLTEIVQ